MGIVVVSKFASFVVTEITKHEFNYRTSQGDFAFAPHFRNVGGIATFSRIPLPRTLSKQYHNISFDLLNFRQYRDFAVGEYDLRPASFCY